MRRNLGGHADGDSIRSINQEAGNARGKNRGLFRGFIIIGNEIHGVFLNVGQHLLSHASQTALGVSVSRCAVTIH